MEDQSEKSNFGLSGPVFRVMPNRDRVRHFRRENWFGLVFLVAWTSFAAWGASVVPRAIITGKPARIEETTVRDWSSINGDVVMFQCITTCMLAVGIYAIRRTRIEVREAIGSIQHFNEREWRISSREHSRTMVIDGFGTSPFTRRLLVEGDGPGPYSFRLSSGFGPRVMVLLNGGPVRERVLQPTGDHDADEGIDIEVLPGATPVIRARSHNPRASERRKWCLRICLLGDPNPPDALYVSWIDRAAANDLTPS